MLSASWIVHKHTPKIYIGLVFLILHLKVETRLLNDTSEVVTDVLNVVVIYIISDYYYLFILLKFIQVLLGRVIVYYEFW
jgi:hypothetical protein